MINEDRILFIDLETTGVDADKHMITQIAAEYHVDGKKENEFFVRMKAMPQPQTAISLEALKITKQSLHETMFGKQPDQIKDEKDVALEEAEGVAKFVDWLLTLDNTKLYICGHNVHFDVGFIKAVLKKYRLEQWDKVVSYRMEDTCTLARTMQKAGLLPVGTVKLGELANMLGISPPKGEHLHNAATDVRVTAKVYYKLLNTLRRLVEGEMQ